MLLEKTISQLDIGYMTTERAKELGQLGYIQWLGWLPPEAAYRREAKRAYGAAVPFAQASPAVAVFCDLLKASIEAPWRPLSLTLPKPARRGGARARRAVF